MSAPRGMPGAPLTWRLTDSWLPSGRADPVPQGGGSGGGGRAGVSGARGVGGWQLGPPRAELHARGAARFWGAAGGRGGCCHGLVNSAAPARISPSRAAAPHSQPLQLGPWARRRPRRRGGCGRGLGAVALGEGGDHLPARRADPGHRPGRAAQPRSSGPRRPPTLT